MLSAPTLLKGRWVGSSVVPGRNLGVEQATIRGNSQRRLTANRPGGTRGQVLQFWKGLPRPPLLATHRASSSINDTVVVIIIGHTKVRSISLWSRCSFCSASQALYLQFSATLLLEFESCLNRFHFPHSGSESPWSRPHTDSSSYRLLQLPLHPRLLVN